MKEKIMCFKMKNKEKTRKKNRIREINRSRNNN